ncbi:replication-relaxation family protein [Paenibacillus sp. GXUN7292]|uniref:replication-relaxation family protein n=1 Tax=Paenibacillus sp. GXUN7292 TaxID=3422499 RepID=UPI003D7EF37A
MGSESGNGYHVGYDEGDEEEVLDEDDGSSGDEPSKGKRKRRRRLRYGEERVCKLVSRNLLHTLVLHSLYVHRRLTVTQIHQMYAPNEHVDRIRSSVRKLSSLGLLERKRIFSLAQTIAETRTYHYNLSPQGVRIYALACMSLNMLHEDPDLPKQTFSHSDLAIGTQTEHHFVLQSFLAECIGRLWADGIYLPSCEWRRYLFLNHDNEALYRPDWILFYPNAFFTSLVEAGRIGEDVLSVPVLSRTDADRAILQEHYKAAISIECDMGTMSPKRLKEKFDRILAEKEHIPRVVAMLVAENRLGEDVRRFSESKVRIRNIGNTIGANLKHEVISDELLFLVGRQTTLTDAIHAFATIKTPDKLYPLIDNLISQRFTHSIRMGAAEWKSRKLELGLPNTTVFDRSEGRVYGFYFAYCGWLNPQVKAVNLIQHGAEDVTVVLVYPSVTTMQSDGHLIHHDRLRYVVYEEWVNGDYRFWQRTMDRSGERWEVGP